MQFFYTQKVFAGVPLQLPYGGLYFVLASAGVARKVGIQLTNNGQDSRVMPDMTPGFSLPVKFDGITFYSDIETIVSFFASPTPVTLGVQDGGIVQVPGGVVITNTAGERVPVDMGGATINVTATNVGINNTDETAVPVRPKAGAVFTAHIDNLDADAVPVVQKVGAVFLVEQATESDVRPYLAATVTDRAQVAVTAAAGVLVAANAARRGLRIKNAGANPVAIGGATLAFATAAVLIQPGETWNENEAPGAAWYCVCDTALASTLNIQDII